MSHLPEKPKSYSDLTGRTKNEPILNSTNPTFKRQKLYNSRHIRTQLQDDAFTNPSRGKTASQQVKKHLKTGIIPNKLNLPDFLAAREFEIKALDSAMIKSKTSGASRVFQSLPRTLRRRTASHNVRRIPKRMRRKALREMGLQLNANGKKVILGTKGVTATGKPIKPKIGRGRSRWSIIRKIKLLKYAARWKLKGKLPNSQWVSYSQINLRKRIKFLKQSLEELTPADMETKEHRNPTVQREIVKIKNLSENIRNNVGSYDNTSVNRVSKITKINCVRYATRQKHFKWLPTHIWHAKRAKMMKRWGWVIPNEPTQRCYRSISRSSRIKGAVAYDTSYVGTLVVNAYDTDSMDKVLLYFDTITKNKINSKRCISKGISWDGYVYNLDESNDPIGRITLVFVKSETGLRVLARLHPSVFTIVFNNIVSEFDECDNITIHDCKYLIGSIDITGPKAITALQSILHNEKKSDQFTKFLNFSKLNDLSTIPEGTVFTFDVTDPRFRTKPLSPVRSKLTYDEQLDLLMSLKNNGVKLSDRLLMPESRAECYNNQMTLKELSKRRALYPGEVIPSKETDVSIDVMLIKSYEQWTILVPWFWVLPFWHTLVHVPHVQIGGFKQLEQLRFERGLLGWSDMIFTTSGYVQSELERQVSESKWEKRPKSKRIEYSKLNLGTSSKNELGEVLSPFGLDWRGLQTLRMVINKLKADNRLYYIENNKPKRNMSDEKLNIVPQSLDDLRRAVKSIQSCETQLKETNMHSLLLKYKPICLDEGDRAGETIDFSSVTFNIKQIPPLPLVPVNLVCVNKGHIKPNSRIYHLDSETEALWRKVSAGELKDLRGKNVRMGSLQNAENYIPRIQNLCGLVTSATFNLVEGKSSAIGFVDSSVAKEANNGVFVVRNVASSSYTLMKWKRVDMSR